LNERNAGFIECKEGLRDSMNNNPADITNPFKDRFKSSFKGTWISNYGYTYELGNAAIAEGKTDLVSFG